MLFILTGTAQTGKTRWLQRLVEQLRSQEIPVYGVLAPGQWLDHGCETCGNKTCEQNACEHNSNEQNVIEQNSFKRTSPSQSAHAQENPSRFEKLGIDNILLPQNQKIVFATRADCASASSAPNTPDTSTVPNASDTPSGVAAMPNASGTPVSSVPQDTSETAPACSQSTQAKLGWAIDDVAISAVNAHFCWMCGLAKDCRLPEDIKRATGVTAQAPAAPGLLVVDEIGPLELLHGGGLTSAMDVLMQGPTPLCAHAVVVMRESLCETAAARFAGCWGEVTVIHPGESAAYHIQSLFNANGSHDFKMYKENEIELENLRARCEAENGDGVVFTSVDDLMVDLND